MSLSATGTCVLFLSAKLRTILFRPNKNEEFLAKKSFYVNFPRISLWFQTLSIPLHLKTLLT